MPVIQLDIGNLSKVRRDHVPDFLRRRLLKRFGTIHRNPEGWHVLQNACEAMPSIDDWLDHWGSAKREDGRTVFVSEPYPRGFSFDASVAELAGEIGCSWSISDDSEHGFGTIRILLYETETSTPINELKRKCMTTMNGGPYDGHELSINTPCINNDGTFNVVTDDGAFTYRFRDQLFEEADFVKEAEAAS